MKLTTKRLKQIIKEELAKLTESSSPYNIYMDIIRRGGADAFLSKAYGRPMKATEDMHYDQALRQYVIEFRDGKPELHDNIWSEITRLLKDTVR